LPARIAKGSKMTKIMKRKGLQAYPGHRRAACRDFVSRNLKLQKPVPPEKPLPAINPGCHWSGFFFFRPFYVSE
jgi:hypothetical protein